MDNLFYTFYCKSINLKILNDKNKAKQIKQFSSIIITKYYHTFNKYCQSGEKRNFFGKNDEYSCNYVFILSPPLKIACSANNPRNRFNNSLLSAQRERGRIVEKERLEYIYITECPFKQINVKVNNQGQITVKVKKTHFGSRSINAVHFPK